MDALASTQFDEVRHGQERVETIYAVAHWLGDRERHREAGLAYTAMARIAPSDERSWLGIGLSYEQIGKPDLALEMYWVGRCIARSVRCCLARARLLGELGRFSEVDALFDDAFEFAEAVDDDDLLDMVRREARRR